MSKERNTRKLQVWIPREVADRLDSLVKEMLGDSERTTAFTGRRGTMGRIVTLALQSYLNIPQKEEPTLDELK